MKLIFISNYLSAHQIPFCDKMYSILGNDFTFISTMSMEQERVDLGWTNFERKYEFYLDSKYKDEAIIKDINEADVVIIGSAPDKLIIKRLKQGKLTFKYAERLYKGDLTFLQWVRAYIGTYLHYARFRKYNFYILCSSAYTCADLNKFFKFKDRCFKWGYFPETKKYDDINDIIESKENNSILWCARLIELKHPEIPVLLAEKLKNNRYKFRLNIIGGGEMDDEIRRLIKDKNLDDCVTMVGVVQQNKVREYMEKSQIFLFTSDSNEGWGAVLNEAMNSGCACVACDEIGSVPFLVCDGENGYTYKKQKMNDIYDKIKILLDDKQKGQCMGRKAYFTIVDEWNAETASIKLLQLIKSLELNRKMETSGVCDLII